MALRKMGPGWEHNSAPCGASPSVSLSQRNAPDSPDSLPSGEGVDGLVVPERLGPGRGVERASARLSAPFTCRVVDAVIGGVENVLVEVLQEEFAQVAEGIGLLDHRFFEEEVVDHVDGVGSRVLFLRRQVGGDSRIDLHGTHDSAVRRRMAADGVGLALV